MTPQEISFNEYFRRDDGRRYEFRRGVFCTRKSARGTRKNFDCGKRLNLIEENTFDAAGKLVSMNTSAVTTADVTSLGAAFFVQENLREEREKISTAEKN